MTSITIKCQIRGCKHFIGALGPKDDPIWVCDAFPFGIPDDIVNGSNLHNKPVAGDEGIQFEAGGQTLKHLAGRHDQSTHGAWAEGEEGKPTKAQLSARVRAKRQRDARRAALQQQGGQPGQQDAEAVLFANARFVMAREFDNYMAGMHAGNYYSARASHDAVLAKALDAKHRAEEAEKAYEDARKPFVEKINALRDRYQKQHELANKAYLKRNRTAEERHQRAMWETENRIQALRDKEIEKTRKLYDDWQRAKNNYEQGNERQMIEEITLFDRMKYNYAQNAAIYEANTRAARAIIMKHYAKEAAALREAAKSRLAEYDAKLAESRARIDALRDEADANIRAGNMARVHELDLIMGRLYDHRIALQALKEKDVREIIVNGFKVANSSGQLKPDIHKGFDDETRAEIESAAKDITEFTGNNKFLVDRGLRFVNFNGRAYASRGAVIAMPNQNYDGLDHVKHAAYHEAGHVLEGADPGLRAETFEFFKRRTAGQGKEPVWGQPMIFGGRDFTEYCIPDKFLDRYMGKSYFTDANNVFKDNESFGEIISMGFTFLAKSPSVLLDDPDFFDFFYSVLRLNQ